MNIPKFRAWHIESKVMMDVIGLTFHPFLEIYCGENEHGEELLFTDDEVILMQSTGLTDKKGVEIFEGDIVRFKFDFESCGEMNHHDGYHMVHTSERGIGLQFKKLAWVDGGKNQVWNVESRGLFFQDKILGYWANDMKSSVQCEMVGNNHANTDLLNDTN